METRGFIIVQRSPRQRFSELVLVGQKATNMRDAWAQTLTKWRLLSVQEEPTIEVGRRT